MSSCLRFFDLLQQTWAPGTPRAALSGQYVVMSATAINGVAVDPPALVASDEDGAVSIVAQDGTRETLQILGAKRGRALATTRQLIATLSELLPLVSTLDDLVSAVSPIVQVDGVDDLLDPDPVQETLRDNLGQVRQVYLAPKSALRFEPERMPVSRARRVSRRATQELASRTEDWLQATASGVVPRVIEALVREEVLDTYENRVAARLLESVQRRLWDRIGLFEELDDLVSHTLEGPWRKQGRSAQLWGSHEPTDELREAIAEIRDETRRLFMVTEQLAAGPLYSEVPRRARVAQPIRATNLLTDDPDYRGLYRLWDSWWRTRGDREDPETRRRRTIEARDDFMKFTWLLLARALLELPSPAAECHLIDPQRFGDGPLDMLTDWGSVQLEPSGEVGSGAWHVRLNDSAPLAIVVALPCEVLDGHENEVRARLDILADALDHPLSDPPTVIVYPGSWRSLERLDPPIRHRCGNVPIAPRKPASPAAWLIPVSPLDLESTERVARAVRWFLLEAILSDYPAAAELPSSSADIIRDIAFLSRGQRAGQIEVRRVPRPGELTELRRRIRVEIRKQDARLPGLGGPQAEALQDGLLSIESAIERLERLRPCPVCDDRGAMTVRGAQTYEVTCPTCYSRWGLRHDPASDDRIPYLWLDVEPPSTDIDYASWLGRDVLAEPCHHPEVPYGEHLINPYTGRCTLNPKRHDACERCLLCEQVE